ncbi:MAG: DUF5362 family protein [candidate division WOR-3 bacterium]
MNGIIEHSRLEGALRGMKGWLKFLGILTIIGGILSALSLIGILYIWLGIVLYQAGSKAQQFLLSKSSDDLADFAGKIRTYFLVTGILALISIILAIVGGCIYAIIIIMAIAGGTFQGLQNY